MSLKNFIEEIPFSTGCGVIKFDDSGLIAISKKAGRASHPNPNGRDGKPPMVRAAYNFDGEYYAWQTPGGEKQKLYLVNRLDSPTSGVILAAANAETAKAAKDAFKNKEVQKTYYAICLGKSIQKKGVWKDMLNPVKAGPFVRSTFGGGKGAPAVCGFSVERHDDNGAGFTLFKLEPLTGITHQLRVQCAKHGFPILGDATYGNFAMNKRFRAASGINRMFLHCAETSLQFEAGGRKVNFSAKSPLPESFGAMLDYNNNIAKLYRPR